MVQPLEYIDHNGRVALVLPCRLGQILWYIHEGQICTAKIFEIKYSASDSGHCGEDFIAFAWNPKHLRTLTWCPIYGEAWLDKKDCYVPVFFSREEAVAAKEDKNEELHPHLRAGD